MTTQRICIVKIMNKAKSGRFYRKNRKSMNLSKKPQSSGRPLAGFCQ